MAPTSLCWRDVEQVNILCRTLPLCRVRCGVVCCFCLRREAPFALLTTDELRVADDWADEQSALVLASALTGHKGME